MDKRFGAGEEAGDRGGYTTNSYRFRDEKLRSDNVQGICDWLEHILEKGLYIREVQSSNQDPLSKPYKVWRISNSPQWCIRPDNSTAVRGRSELGEGLGYHDIGLYPWEGPSPISWYPNPCPNSDL